MSIIFNKSDKLNGEQELAREILKISPLIEKHFKPAHGLRVTIGSGAYSAKFQKVISAFREDCATVSDARIYTDSSYSVRVNIDIHTQDTPRAGAISETCSYYKDSIYVGETGKNISGDHEIFQYTYKADEIRAAMHKILAVTIDDIETAHAEIKRLTAAIDSKKSSIPYVLRELLKV